MADLTEHHEVRVRGENQTIVFSADTEDGRLVIRQVPDGKDPKDVCAITLSNPDELRAFFTGLRRILSSLGLGDQASEQAGTVRAQKPRAVEGRREEQRETVVAEARQKNPQAFAPWTKAEEQEIRRRHDAGESVQAIAHARKRSPRAIQLRLQRLGVLPPDE